MGCQSTGAATALLASQEAMVEAIFKAKELGFDNIIGLTQNRSLDHIWHGNRKANWPEQTLLEDMQHLNQQGLTVTLKTAYLALLVFISNFVLLPALLFLSEY
nr:hypothetical protein CFP56_16412 [Quercus suber]